MNKLRLLLISIVLIGCDRPEDHDPLPDKVVGTYEGFLNYGEIPIGDDDMVEPVTFDIVREGKNNIRISTTFDLVIKVSRTFISDFDGDEIVTLGEGTDVKHNSNGIEIVCGDSDWNNWGEMCGYYNVASGKLNISFAWSDGTTGGSGYIFAYRQQ